jgi:NAD(P)-dependent dehydrogenase (short-subunit alcohol dehydrogenase family)
MGKLDNKIAVVTGASTPHGIGRAIALRLAREGASLFLVADRLEEELRQTQRLCRDATGPGQDFEAAVMDLGQAGQPEEMIRAADRRFGRVDVLVNNAAIRAPYDFGDYTREVFDRMISVNLAAAFFANQAVVPLMRQQGGGRIINVASHLGQVATDQYAVYGLTKAALVHLTRSMAYELCRDNILVNSVSPGPIATQPLRDLKLHTMRELYEKPVSDASAASGFPRWNAQMLDKVPLGRLGEVDEVAGVVLYLAAESPAFMIGQNLVVDGGCVLI